MTSRERVFTAFANRLPDRVPAWCGASPEFREPGCLKRDFGNRIVLNGCIDTHHVLIKGTPNLVRRRTREIVEIMKR